MNILLALSLLVGQVDTAKSEKEWLVSRLMVCKRKERSYTEKELTVKRKEADLMRESTKWMKYRYPTTTHHHYHR